MEMKAFPNVQLHMTITKTSKIIKLRHQRMGQLDFQSFHL
jgi:hypothetical protein